MTPAFHKIALCALIVLGACDGGLDLVADDSGAPPPSLRSFGHYRTILAEGAIPTPDALDARALITAHDFELPAPECAAPLCPVARAVTFTDPVTDEELTISALALATASPEPKIPQGADHVLVIDLSASMAGERLDATRSALGLALAAMAPEDRVTLVLFADGVTTPIVAAKPGDPALAAAVAGLQAGGKANLAAGLDAAFGALEPAPERPRHVVLVTDGPPTTGQTDLSALAEVVAEAARAGAALDVLALGVDVPRGALETMAEAGGGRFAWAEEAGQTPELLPSLAARVPVARAVDAAIEGGPGGDLTWLGTTRPPADATGPWRLPLVALSADAAMTAPVLAVTPGGVTPSFELSYQDPATGQPVSAADTTPPDPSTAAQAGSFEPALAWIAATTLERASTLAVAGDADGARAALAIATGILVTYADDPDVARDLSDLELFLDNLGP